MAFETNKITLPRSVASVVTEKAKDSSTIMQLSPNKPKIFDDETFMVFSPNAEADVVAEGAKSAGYEKEKPAEVVGTRLVLQTTTRVSAQMQWADEDNQLEIIKQIQEDQAAAVGRALDYIIYHGASPKTGLPISGFSKLSDRAAKAYLGAALASATENQLIASIDAMAELVNDLYEVSGVALSKGYANALRRIRVKNTMNRMFPEIPLNLQVASLDGIPAATSGTVNGRKLQTPTNVLAFMGDFSCINWGVVRDMEAEIIPYGDPDGTGKDLKNYNQIAYRTTGVYSYAVLDPAAFSVLLGSAAPTTPNQGTQAGE